MSDIIEAMIDRRRRAAGADSKAPRWGLALSGGGIRSATFCLGLLKALADKRMLLRFDLISTVSGGGYVGAMLGRLFSRCRNVDEAAGALDAFAATRPPWFLWWLRSNGRYLIPSGAADTVFAFALYARNTLAVHVELGLVGLLLGSAIVLFDLGAWALRAALAGGSTLEAVLRWAMPQQQPEQFLPALAFALPLLVWVSAMFACAYWGARMVQQRRAAALLVWCAWLVALAVVADVAVGLFLAADAANAQAATPLAQSMWPGWLTALAGQASALLGSQSQTELPMRAAFIAFGIVASSSWLVGLPLAAAALAVARRHDPAASGADALAMARNRLTRALAVVIAIAAIVAGLVAVDRVAWVLAFERQGLLGAGALLVVLAVAVRAGAPVAAMLKPGGFGTATLLRLANLLGLFVAFLLIAWWVSLVQRAALGAVFGGHQVELRAGFVFVALIALPSLGYVLLTRANMDFLNVSSLQTFYRSRLVRAYLGAVNPGRYRDAVRVPLRPRLEPAEPLPDEPDGGYDVLAVSDVDADDDLPMHDYAPHACGAPVHLLTACLNQTDDPRGRFNRDRRGVPLTIAPQGHFRVDAQPWRQVERERSLTLGHWVSISGGAFSPGLGQNTRAGVAALATFAGVRLGWWWDGLADATSRTPWFQKTAALLDEARGHFPGATRRHAFLSDGGHAENTGVWPLLVERCELIVLADCGADPGYRFEDLENLIRRARIDLQAKIRFLVPKSTPVPDPFGRFGTLDDLASASSTACIAIARIEYEGGAQAGHLMLVKPNIWPQLPPDVANYRAANPSFPQQTTLDQFFDEAQWESYYALGCALGHEALEVLDKTLEPGFAEAAERLFEADDEAVTRALARRRAGQQRELRDSLGARLLARLSRPAAPADKAAGAPAGEAAKPANGRLVPRLTASAVNASIGLGAAATVALSAYQAIDSLRSAAARQTSDEHAALKEIADLWAKMPPASSPSASGAAAPGSPAWRVEVEAPAALAAALARTSDTLCPAEEAGWFRQSPLAASIFQDALAACRAAPAGARAAACDWLVQRAASPSAPSCLYQQAGPVVCEPRYWGYHYEESEVQRCVAPKRAQRQALEASRLAAVGLEAEAALAAAEAGRLAAAGSAAAGAASQAAAGASAVAQRVASAASAVAAEAAAATPPGEAACAKSARACCGKTVYVQVFGAEDRAEARALRPDLQRLGASLPPIDDVVASARARNRIAPSLVPAISVRYSDAGALACAEGVLAATRKATGQSAGRVLRLADPYAQRHDQVELWLPPSFSSSATPSRLPPSASASLPMRGPLPAPLGTPVPAPIPAPIPAPVPASAPAPTAG